MFPAPPGRYCLLPWLSTRTLVQHWNTWPPTVLDTQTLALLPSRTSVMAAIRSCRLPSSVLQTPSLGRSNFNEAVLPEIDRAARSSNSPVSKRVPPSGSGHDSEAGSGKLVFPARDTCAIPRVPGGIGDGLAGLQASTTDRLIVKEFPCALRFRVAGLMLQTGCMTASGECTHPDLGSQASAVQELPSSQFGGGPPAHWPFRQTSPVVQALPSSQGAELSTWTHPDDGLQESSVQPFPSSQETAKPVHRPSALQVSARVQALPSSQAVSGAGVKTHWPLTHASMVQLLLSLQTTGEPMHRPSLLHVSPRVQASPSSQVAPSSSSWRHCPVAESQESRVHWLPSSQSTGVPLQITPLLGI